jgi:hypothetical protein
MTPLGDDTEATTAVGTHRRRDPRPASPRSHPALDDRDIAIIHRRLDAFDERTGPRVGDYVRFADGVLRRISYHWTDGTGWDGGCQSSDGGSFHLNDGGCSFSGSLYSTVPTESLTLTDERRDGRAWIFHHDLPKAHNGVDFIAECRVYESSANAPR